MKIKGTIKLLPILLALTLMGCDKEKGQQKGKVTLVFENPASKQVKVKYLDDWAIPQVTVIQNNKPIHIITFRDYVDIELEERSGPIYHFLFQNGDSVHIDLGPKWPGAQVMNRETTGNEHNFEKWVRNKLYGNEEAPIEKFLGYWEIVNGPASLLVSGSDIADELLAMKKGALDGLKQEAAFIDSLQGQGGIPSPTASYFKAKNIFWATKLAFYGIDSIECANDGVLADVFGEENTGMLSPTGTHVIYTFYNSLLDLYYNDCLAKGTENKKGLQEFMASIGHLPSGMRNPLVFKHTSRLLTSASVQENSETLEHLDNNPLYEKWRGYFFQAHNILEVSNTDWVAYNNKDEHLTFDELLYKHKGKLLYVDIWASWCEPCLYQMSYSKELMEEYKDKDVAFAHISLDKERKNWERAEDRFLGFNLENSYSVDSLNYLLLKKTFGVDFIPRYLLFDKNGGLIHAYCPKPGTEEIRELLDGYLDMGL